MSDRRFLAMMKGYIDSIQNGTCSRAEIILVGICLILIGIVLGMLLAPARFFVAGSFNGNQGSIGKPEDVKNESQN